MGQMWGPLMYIALPYVPELILEFAIYPFMPQYDTPFIPFEVWIEELSKPEPLSEDAKTVEFQANVEASGNTELYSIG